MPTILNMLLNNKIKTTSYSNSSRTIHYHNTFKILWYATTNQHFIVILHHLNLNVCFNINLQKHANSKHKHCFSFAMHENKPTLQIIGSYTKLRFSKYTITIVNNKNKQTNIMWFVNNYYMYYIKNNNVFINNTKHL